MICPPHYLHYSESLLALLEKSWQTAFIPVHAPQCSLSTNSKACRLSMTTSERASVGLSTRCRIRPEDVGKWPKAIVSLMQHWQWPNNVICVPRPVHTLMGSGPGDLPCLKQSWGISMGSLPMPDNATPRRCCGSVWGGQGHWLFGPPAQPAPSFGSCGHQWHAKISETQSELKALTSVLKCSKEADPLWTSHLILFS